MLAERILEETEVMRLMALEPNRRNHALLRLLYLAGLRLSEAAALSWHDLCKRGAGGQVAVFGKGGKTRAVLLPRLRSGANSSSSAVMTWTRHRCSARARAAPVAG